MIRGGKDIAFDSSHTIVLKPVAWQERDYLEQGYDFQVIKRTDIPSKWKISDDRTIEYLDMRIDNCIKNQEYATALKLSIVASSARMFKLFKDHCEGR